MIRLDTFDDEKKFLIAAFSDAEPERNDTATYQSRCRCYNLGAQWIQSQAAPAGWARLTREAQNLIGEAGPIRATVNRITKLCIQIAASTNPEKLYVDAVPPDSSSDMLAAKRADAIESAANAMIDACGLVQRARIANNERVISGLHGIGICCEYVPVSIDTEEGAHDAVNHVIRAFEFDATRLTLDPGNPSTDLLDHEYVIYSETMTAHAIKRLYGEDAITKDEENKLQTLGQLMPIEMRFNSLSGGSLYRRYAAHSNTKAAYIHALHTKGPDGRFSGYRVYIELGRGNYRRLNRDDQSPFGGSGLPYVLIRGWSRSQSRVPISDVGMMIDDQDKLNLVASLYFQQVYNYTGQYSWSVDRRFFGTRTEDADIHRALFSRVVIGDPDPNASPPKLTTFPEPSQSLELSMQRHEQSIEQQGFRAEAHQGRTKSNVTNAAFVRTLELSELPLDDRMADDVHAHEQLIRVIVGTTIIALRSGSPITAKILVSNGLSPDDLALIAESDPYDPPAQLAINTPSVRHRSRSARRQDLIDLAAIAGMQGPTVRRILARDLDQPISDLDKHALTYARDAAIRVMFGQPFTPLPLGPDFGETLIEEFRRAMTTSQAANINGAVERLADAVTLQQQQIAAEIAMLQAAAQPQPAAQPPADELLMQSVFG